MHVNILAGRAELTQAGTVFFPDRKVRLCTLLSAGEGCNPFCIDRYTCDVFLRFFLSEKHQKSFWKLPSAFLRNWMLGYHLCEVLLKMRTCRHEMIAACCFIKYVPINVRNNSQEERHRELLVEHTWALG